MLPIYQDCSNSSGSSKMATEVAGLDVSLHILRQKRKAAYTIKILSVKCLREKLENKNSVSILV